MPPIPFADNFLAGSLLTLLLPICLLIAIATWYVLSARHVYEETPPGSAALPAPEVVAAAKPDPSAPSSSGSAPPPSSGSTPSTPPTDPPADRS